MGKRLVRTRSRVAGVRSRLAVGVAVAIVALLPLGGGAAPGDYQDSDNDGVPDWDEQILGTNPYDPSDHLDSDYDGVPDALEVAIGDDPYVSNADYDADWLSDADEAAWGTYPDVMDSDGDSVWDGIEVRCNTSPIDPTWYDHACGAYLLGGYVDEMGATQPIIDESFDPSHFCDYYDPTQVCP